MLKRTFQNGYLGSRVVVPEPADILILVETCDIEALFEQILHSHKPKGPLISSQLVIRDYNLHTSRCFLWGTMFWRAVLPRPMTATVGPDVDATVILN